jgi:chromosomal replication initiation ATPase DnaA
MIAGSTSLEFDARLTFESFIVGTSNRLAAAAARRVAAAPGAAYNPLFVYSASGLGKTHLIQAIGNHITRAHPDVPVVYETLERLMEGVMEAIQAGERDAFRSRLRNASVLLLDDVQFLAGRRGAQEELLRAWDTLAARGGQIVLASDRPPSEIDDLDQRLLSRFSGGLIVDLSPPDYETRVAIVRRKTEERGHSLSDGVAETLAKVAFGNVRELQGGLNRVLAVQELDDRLVSAEEAARLLGVQAPHDKRDEFGHFLDQIADTLTEVVARVTPEQKLADAIRRWSSEEYQTRRLEAGIGVATTHDAVDELIERYESDVARLRGIVADVQKLDSTAPELGRLDILRNPERIAEAESLLEQVRERVRPLRPPPERPTFAELRLDPELHAVRAARVVSQRPGDPYNPFFVYGGSGTGKTALVTALALDFRTRDPGAPVAFLTGAEFSTELIAAIERNQVDGWRARYRRARLIVIDGVESLMGTERAQEELFHLFDDARRAGVQLVFTAVQGPRELSGFEDRLRTRLESGLVFELTGAAAGTPIAEPLPANIALSAAAPRTSGRIDEFFLNREKLLWNWPYTRDLIVGEHE